LPIVASGKAARLHVVEESFDCLVDRWHDGLDDADLTRGLPAANQILRGFPGDQIQTAPEVVACERTLDPQRARAFLAAGIAARLAEVFAVFGVATVDRERHARIFPRVWYKTGTLRSNDLLSRSLSVV
jgi:hypothetical protein